MLVYRRLEEYGTAVVELLLELTVVVVGKRRTAADLLLIPPAAQHLAEEEDVHELFFKSFDEAELKEDGKALLQNMRQTAEQNYHLVPGREVGYVKLVRDVHHTCTMASFVRLSQYDHDAAMSSTSNCLKLQRQSSNCLKIAQAKFERRAEVDILGLRHFISSSLSNPPPLSPIESSLLSSKKNLLQEDENHHSKPFARIRGSLSKRPSMAMFECADPETGNVWGKASAAIDTSAETVVAYLWNFMSYNRLKTFEEENGTLPRYETVVPNSRTKLMVSAKRFPKGLGNRLFEAVWVWDKVSDERTSRVSYHLAFCPPDEYYGGGGESTVAAGAGFVKAKTSGIWRVESLLGVSNSTNICRVVLVQTADFGGILPKWVANSKVESALTTVHTLQNLFRRSDKTIDEEIHSRIAERMINFNDDGVEKTPPDSILITQIYEKCRQLENDFEEGEGTEAQLLVSDSPFEEYSRRLPQLSTSSGRVLVITKAVVVLDQAADIVAAWVFDYCGRFRMRMNFEDGNLPRLFLEEVSPRHTAYASIKRMPFPFSVREFVFNYVWVKLPSGEIIICADSIEDNSRKLDYGDDNVAVVRALNNSYWVLTPVGPKSCLLKLYTKIDTKGYVPVSIVNAKSHTSVGLVGQLRKLFERDDEKDEEDRAAMVDGVLLQPHSPHTDKDALAFDLVRQETTDSIIIDSTCITEKRGLFLTVTRAKLKKRIEEKRRRSSLSTIVGAAPAVALSTGVVAEVVVDARLEQCIAWDFLKCSRRRTQSFYEKYGGASRSEQVISAKLAR